MKQRNKFHKGYVIFSCHEWREMLPLGTGYKCSECGGFRKDFKTEHKQECIERTIPESWLSKKENK